ncbi:MAG: NAD(P)H-dependent flavin oxidoreductase YrpB (nitropropane dioxygenase family) [Flavobacterium sp.]|jgi:NAD(P)H-dependent flavin oxidoreductase YrpB (nitropropane dioxygenase family)
MSMKTIGCELLGIEIPIIQAPMGGAAGPKLAAAVSNAGGLGTLPLWTYDIETTRSQIRATKAITSKPFAVNLNMDFPQEERLDLCLDEGVPIISFFWKDSSKLVTRAKSAGAIVLHSVATADEARRAVDSGVDILIAQGWEAGGHVRGQVASMPLIPTIVDVAGSIPVIAAGGISDGRGLAASLCLGASGAWIGTRFLASEEVDIHPEYRKHLLKANENDTVHLDNLFDVGWRNAPHRVLRNSTVKNWEDSGKARSGERPGEGDIIGHVSGTSDLVRYMSHTPRRATTGDIEAMSMWAGQGVAMVQKIQPAAEIVQEIHNEAMTVLQGLGVKTTH